ncbi:hypothetical protein RV17_GL000619 [Enterococcus thailandicus]|nr:hypothetical protein RV17_GL000619 [Enterococcus thailandicus]
MLVKNFQKKADCFFWKVASFSFFMPKIENTEVTKNDTFSFLYSVKNVE